LPAAGLLFVLPVDDQPTAKKFDSPSDFVEINSLTTAIEEVRTASSLSTKLPQRYSVLPRSFSNRVA
jgi:hypothetical protein